MLNTTKKLGLIGLVSAGVIAAAATADVVTFGGVLADGDATWTGTGNGTENFFEVMEFTVDADGEYGFYSFYPGDASLDENMDGFIRIFEGSFDPTGDPALNIASDDDYSDGDIAILDPFDDDAVGANASGTTAVLTAGTTYFMVQTTFTDVPTSFGQPTGAYESTIVGDGTITLIPAPAAIAFFGLAGLAGMRRRRG
ncbi:MAG: hypothetical protein AB8G96_09185 [Phycisphaerales bacterium]